MNDIIITCKQIVGHFSHSQLAYNKLAMLQTRHDLPQHKLIQDAATRWNSTYFMLSRMLEQKAAVTSYSIDSDIANIPVIDGGSWKLIDNIVSLLKVFHEITSTE